MRAALLGSLVLALGGTLACGALTGVDWDQVKVQGDGGGASSGGTSGASGGASGGTSGSPTGTCAGEQVECLSADGVACCPNGGEPGLPVTLAAGSQNTCAIAETGQIKCWGPNGSGQLGRGAPGVAANTPQLVYRIPTGATQITVGGSYVCAIVDGRLACWGTNSSGQFGNGSTADSSLPIVIPLPAAPDSIGAGAATTCGSFGGVGMCWGSNTASQAGSETDPLRVISPKAVKGLPTIGESGQVIVAARDHACASGLSGLFCWGTNNANRLGSSGPTQSATAVAVVNGSAPATRVALGDLHGCALRGGRVQCWGSNTFGEAGGVGLPSNGAITPADLGSGVTALCAGGNHTCVVQAGVVKCFGDNSQGQGGFAPGLASIATAVEGLSGFVAKDVACGQFHTCAISTAGAIKCWGINTSGELGDGTADMKSVKPRDVKW